LHDTDALLKEFFVSFQFYLNSYLNKTEMKRKIP